MMQRAFAIVLLVSLWAPAVHAQDAGGTDKPKTKVNQAALDLSVPESPAFAALDLSPETITRPSAPRDLATALLSGVDKNGNLQTGVAIDAAPFPLFLGANYSLEDYNADPWIPVLWRTQLSRPPPRAQATTMKPFGSPSGFA